MWIFVIYLLACSAAFVLPSTVGENIARLRFMALPLAVLALSLRHWRPRMPAIALLALAASWNLTPLGWTVDRNVGDSAGTATYWADTGAFLHTRLTPNHRVEVVDTASHWASYYLARQGIPLARGWYRQDDFPQNALLYNDMTARRYLAWLHRLAVLYVVLPDVKLDYSSEAEAKLLRSSANPLRPVTRLRHVTVFEVPDAQPMVSGAGVGRGGRADAEDNWTHALGPWPLSGRRPVLALLASQPWMRQSNHGWCDRTVRLQGWAIDDHTRRRAAQDARDARRPRPQVPGSKLIRRLRRRGLTAIEHVVVPIAVAAPATALDELLQFE